MRFKPIPPAPADLDAVSEAQRAVPLVPGSETDCCARIGDSLDLPSRDVARTWLTFLRAIGLVRESEAGFVRQRVELDRETLAEGLRDGVYGGRELLDALCEEPLTPAEAFQVVEGMVPRWERDRDPNWRETWRERVERLLEWLVLAGLAKRRDGGYVRPD